MGAEIQRPSGLYHSLLPFNHAAQLPKVNSNCIPLWMTELDPCQGQCEE